MRSRKGFTLLETTVAASIMMVLAAVALLTFGALAGRVQESQIQRIADAGNAALRLDFSRQIVGGGYRSPFPDDKQKVGKKLRTANEEALEAMLLSGGYPEGFRWILVQAATPNGPPIVAGEVS